MSSFGPDVSNAQHVETQGMANQKKRTLSKDKNRYSIIFSKKRFHHDFKKKIKWNDRRQSQE